MSTVVRDCTIGQVCSDDGHCRNDPNAPLDAGQRADAGALGGDGRVDDPQVCGNVTLVAKPTTPNVILIIDQSSSMDEKFGTGTRWSVLRESLLAENGLIKELEHTVRFGAAFYSARSGDKVCPLVTEVELAIDNFATIRDKFPAKTVAETPTGDAIEAVLSKIPEETVLDPNFGKDPTIFILATDGEPDRCEELNPQRGQQEALDAVKHAHMRGIRTYIIAVADEVSQGHVNDIANAGVGNTSGTQAASYRANDDKGLRDALRSIIAGEVSCDVPLEGTVTGNACEGTIRVGTKALACNDANGFELFTPSVIRLKGSACDAIKKGEVLTARFPCGTAIPLL